MKWLERDFALHSDQGAKALAGDFEGRIREFFNRLSLFERRSKERMAAEIGKCPAKLRLKDHNQGDREKDRQAAQIQPITARLKSWERNVKVKKSSASPMRMRAPCVPRR